MSFSKKLLTVAAPAALLALSACATGFPAQVSRYQAMPAPAGQSFFIQPAAGAEAGLEFARYADLVRRHMIAQGYSEAASPRTATMIVNLDYGVDNGRTEVATYPGSRFGRGFGPYSYGPYGGYGGFYRPYYSRVGYLGRYRSPFNYD